MAYLLWQTSSLSQHLLVTQHQPSSVQALLLFGDLDQAAGGSCQAGAPKCQCSWNYPGETACSYHIEGTGLISLAHDAGKEIYPSIGGWTLRYVLYQVFQSSVVHLTLSSCFSSLFSGAFPAMSANPTSRKKFAENCRWDIHGVGWIRTRYWCVHECN